MPSGIGIKHIASLALSLTCTPELLPSLNDKGEEKWSRDIVPDDFIGMFEEVLYNFISRNVEWDWVNNDGGYGNVEINVDTGELTINHTQRHTEDYEYTIKENPITEALA